MLQTHKESGLYGIRSVANGTQALLGMTEFGIISRASDMLIALSNMDPNTGIVYDVPGSIVAGGPFTQSGRKELVVNATGYVVQFEVGDRAGDVIDAVRTALENNVIGSDWIVALPFNGVMTFVDPIHVPVIHPCFGPDGQPHSLQPYILDWPLRMRANKGLK